MTTNTVGFTTKEISATSRASVKIGDSYFTFEASETRTVNMDKLSSNLEEAQAQIEEERLILWDTVNAQVDNQILETQEFLKKKR